MLVLAVLVAALAAASPAVAGTYQTSCWLAGQQACGSTEKHTYNDAGVYAPNSGGTYVGADIITDAGTIRAYCTGYGSCYAWYRDNTGSYFRGWWWNQSPAGTASRYVIGTFHY